MSTAKFGQSGTLTLQEKALFDAAEKAWRDTSFLLANEFTKAITSNVWNWPVGESPRDIIDTGQLRSSQQVQLLSGLKTRYSWNTEYAAPVWYGYTTRAGNNMPGRPWTTHALERFNVEDAYSKLYQRYVGI